jgi:YHS domain-containing protein/predicted small lipoprotein YifL
MNLRKVILLTAVVVIGFSLTACKKKGQLASPSPVKPKAATSAVAVIEQTKCPVMDGNPIDKNVFVEYKGKKVYFCCEKCKAAFEKDPEKYIAKLPQFAK